MDKPLRYYIKRCDFYQSMAHKIPVLEDYFYIQERFYYNGSKNSFEYKELTKIGEYIITYILKYAELLEAKEIESLFTYILFLLDNNYLSYDIKKDYDYNLINFNELPILPYISFNYHGKCRHLAALLANILNKETFNAYVLAGIRQEPEEAILHKASAKTNLNHAIVVAEDDEYTYILDPSKNEVYFTEDSKSLYSSRFAKFDLKEMSKVSFGDKMFFHLTPTKPYKGINIILNNMSVANAKFNDNIDIFNDLHQEIKPALKEAEEVYQKILSIANYKNNKSRN